MGDNGTNGFDYGRFWDSQASPLVQNLLKLSGKFGVSDLGIRIVGEKGTGKLPLARIIHERSSRTAAPFLHLKCQEIRGKDMELFFFGEEEPRQGGSAIVKGALEGANGGTAYFERYSALPPAVRARIQQTVEQRHFRRRGGFDEIPLDIRFIASFEAEDDLETGGDDGARRISPVSINVPPLRERRSDIAALVSFFLEEINPSRRVPIRKCLAGYIETLIRYAWPGNVYELRNVVRHSAALCAEGPLDTEHVPEYIRNEIGGMKLEPRRQGVRTS